MNNLGLIQNQIQYMPDALLAQEVHNPNGAIPQYMALAELNRRQKLRQGAPKPQPQGTVADDVLRQIHAAGMQGNPGMQTMDAIAPGMPPRQGIAAAPTMQPMPPQPQGMQPVGMRRGGIVRLANSKGTVGQNVSDADGYDYGDYDQYNSDQPPVQNGINQAATANSGRGGAAGLTSLLFGDVQPVQYRSPDPTTPDQARAAVMPLWGQPHDYTPTLNEIEQLKRQQPQPLSDRDRFELAAGLAAVSKEANPVIATGQGSLAAWQAQRDSQQNYVNNDLGLINAQTGIYNRQDQRQEQLAQTLLGYSQMRDQFNRLNAHDDFSSQLQAQQLQRQMDMLATQTIKETGSIGGAIGLQSLGQQLMSQAKKENDPDAIAKAQDILDIAKSSINANYDAEKQKNKFDIQKAVATAQASANAQADVMTRLWFTHPGTPGTPTPGSPQSGTPGSPATQTQFYDPSSNLDVQAVEHLLTNRNVPGGRSAVPVNGMITARATQILQNAGLDPGTAIPVIQNTYAANKKALNDLQTTYSNINSYEQNVKKGITNLVGAGDDIYTTKWELLNKYLVPAEVSGSVDNAKRYQTFLSTTADEYAKVMQGYKGVTGDQAREHANDILSKGLSNHNLHEAVAALQVEMDNRTSSLRDEMVAATTRTTFPALVQYAKTGTYPDNGTFAGAGGSLPDGAGKHLDAATAVMFLRAANGDRTKAQQLAKDNHWVF